MCERHQVARSDERGQGHRESVLNEDYLQTEKGRNSPFEVVRQVSQHRGGGIVIVPATPYEGGKVDQGCGQVHSHISEKAAGTAENLPGSSSAAAVLRSGAVA